jgi:ATP-dependent RNA helicase DeaD
MIREDEGGREGGGRGKEESDKGGGRREGGEGRREGGGGKEESDKGGGRREGGWEGEEDITYGFSIIWGADY